MKIKTTKEVEMIFLSVTFSYKKLLIFIRIIS